MTLIDVLIILAIIVGVGFVAYWIIVKFIPGEFRTVALAVVGVILLIVLLVAFFPGAGNYRVWR